MQRMEQLVPQLKITYASEVQPMSSSVRLLQVGKVPGTPGGDQPEFPPHSDMHIPFKPGDYRFAVSLAVQGEIGLKSLVAHR